MSNRFSKSLWSFWIVLAATPLAGLVLGSGSTVRATIGLYLIGTLVIWIARKRDPDGAVLRTLWTTRAGRGLLVMAILFVQLLSFALPGTQVWLVILALVVFLNGLWAIHKTPETLHATVKRLLALAGSLILLAMVAEIVFRLPLVVRHTGGDTPGSSGWEKRYSDRLWETTLMSFRSRHLDDPKPPGVLRILALGDSFTFGHKLATTDDTWPYQLEGRLIAEGQQVQVINLAKVGYTTVNEAELLRRFGWRYEPNLVVLQFTINDVLPSGPNLRAERGGWHFKTYPLLPLAHESLERHSYAYSFLDGRWRRAQVQLRYPDGWTPLYHDDSEGWQECQAAIREIAAWTSDRGIPVLMVMFPMFLPGPLDGEHYPYRGIHEKVGGCAAAAGIPFVDLLPIYARSGRTGRSYWALPTDSHPGKEAHSLAAEAVAGKLRELGWEPSTEER